MAKLSDILKSLSMFGMKYDDMIAKNKQAISSMNLYNSRQEQNLYGMLSQNYIPKSNEDYDFYAKSYFQKRQNLRRMAAQPELIEILDKMTDECILSNSSTDENEVCSLIFNKKRLEKLDKSEQKKIEDAAENAFYLAYSLLGWDSENIAWTTFKKWLIDGLLAYEIVFDDVSKPTKINAILPLDPATLTKTVLEDGSAGYIQFKGVLGKEKVLRDAQVIYIKYYDDDVSEIVSYLDGLLRPFNIYRVMEQNKIIYSTVHANYKMLCVIPTTGMNNAQSLETISAAMARYKEDISFDVNSGELKVNGRTNLPFNKEIWTVSNEAGTPEFSQIGGDGPNLSDPEDLKLWEKKLYKASKMPLNRFNSDDSPTWSSDPTATTREEIFFSNATQRLKSAFKKIILKPIKIQIALDLKLTKQEELNKLSCVDIKFASLNVFNDMMEIDILQKRSEFIASFKDSLIDTDSEGNEVKFWSNKYLAERFLKMNPEDLELNNKYKNAEAEKLQVTPEEPKE